ncbi:MAG: class I SAM-dependent methyltransferase, partial [Dehalococcoidia bacterium]
MDLGTGDGRAVLAAARRDPTRLYIGIDANLDGLAQASTRASRRPERGGAANAWFVRASAECLPPELDGLACGVTVLLPWGSLLDAVLRPDVDVLRGIRRLCAPGAAIEVVVSLEASRDGAAADLGAPSVARLRSPYRAASLDLRSVQALDRAALAATGTTWAGRLAHG